MSTHNRCALFLLAAVCLAAAGCRHPAAIAQPTGPTEIIITGEVLHTNVRRFGINIGGQSFYDSGQILRNLIFRNPGFEGGTWQSILRCKTVTANTCTDQNQYTVWPTGFLNGATYEIISGASAGAAGKVQDSTAAASGRGVILSLQGKIPGAGDFVLVRLPKPGHAEAGWWPGLEGGAQLTTELHDLPPGTLGTQALRIDAAAPGQVANISSYFDSLEGHSFLQLRGTYTLRFRARALSPLASVQVDLTRLDTTAGRHNFFSRLQPLTPVWRDYSYTFNAQEPRSSLGTLGLTFRLEHASALLDDVSLTEAAAPGNPTPFRNAVVDTLRALHPGVLRYMDSGGNFGSSIDNMIAPVFARQRTGASTQESLHEDIPLGLQEFLELCQAIGAEPWYAMPPGTSPTEAAALIEYLAGPADTPYGRRRAALGHPASWISAFPTMHLELGNENWNARSFAGSAIDDPTAYGQRTTAVFAAMRRAPAFQASSFDLIEGTWSAVPWWTGKQLAASSGVDSVAIAPYLFNDFNDASSNEAVFGPMFAQPQLLNEPGGLMAQQRAAAGSHGLAVYEVNLGTGTGSANQAQIDAAVPSLGAGLALAEHMLLLLRDQNVTTDCLFALPQYRNNFSGEGTRRTMPLWGAVVDMGGGTDRRRPQFLAEQLLNSALYPTELRTRLSGADPGWHQPKSSNDNIALEQAHDLLSFAFTDGAHHSLILLNLSRTDAHPVTLSGQAPVGSVREQRLNAPNLADSNEQSELVTVTTRSMLFPRPYTLPAHSLTVLTW